MFYKIFKKIMLKFVKVGYVGVYQDDAKYFVCLRKLRNKKVINEELKSFDSVDGGKISNNMKAFFEKFYGSVRYSYLATLNLEKTQGLLLENTLENLNLESEDIVKISLDRGTLVFSLKKDIEKIEQTYNDVSGVDFIFPFEAVIEILKSPSNPNAMDLNIITTNDYAFFCIFFQNKIIYVSHHKFSQEDAIVIEDPKSEETRENSEEFDDSFSGLDEMEDLEELGGVDEPAVEEDDEGELEDDFENAQSEEDAKRDLSLFSFIDSSLKDFYKNPNYPSDFISNVHIFQSAKVNSAVKKHIENVFFIEPEIFDFDLPKTLCDLCIQEAKKW